MLQNYEEFDLANEMDDLEKFLKLPLGSLGTNSPGNGNGISNGTPASREVKFIIIIFKFLKSKI